MMSEAENRKAANEAALNEFEIIEYEKGWWMAEKQNGQKHFFTQSENLELETLIRKKSLEILSRHPILWRRDDDVPGKGTSTERKT